MMIGGRAFVCLLCSLGAFGSFGLGVSQAGLNEVGLEDYKRYGARLREVAEDLLVREGYRVDLDSPIGAGYNGVVFKGTNIKGENVAIKLSSSDATGLLMTRSSSWKPHTVTSYHYKYSGELELARRFVHYETYYSARFEESPNRVKIYMPVDLGAGLPKIHALYRFLDLDNGKDWSIITVMDWIDGEDLKAYVDKNIFGTKDVLDWILKILEALRPLHERGWVHRDLNASNIMIRQDGSICVIDLGKVIDWYDRDKNTVPPWHNPNLIQNRDCDPDLSEMHVLVSQLFASGEYERNDERLHGGILNLLGKAKDCKELWDGGVALRGKC